mgnify:CR=1 FL=1
MDDDTAIHIGTCDAIEFFQGHTDLVVGVGSSHAGDGQGVTGFGDGYFAFCKGFHTQPLGFDRLGGFFLIKHLAFLHDDGGTKSGEKDFLDTVLGFESRTGSLRDASSRATDVDKINGGGLGHGFFDRWLGGRVVCV